MKILLATDGSKHAEGAAKKCFEIINIKEDSEIKIISVAEPASPIAPDPFGATHEFYLRIKDESQKIATNAVESLKEIIEKTYEGDKKLKIETTIVSNSPKVAIVEEAKSWGADLIVVGSHGYGFWERMLIGSVSDAVIHHSPCSVLVVKDEYFDDKEEEF